MSRSFIGEASTLIAAEDQRLMPAWWPWLDDERATVEVPYNYRTRHWPRPGGLDGGIIEAMWYDRPELVSGVPFSPVFVPVVDDVIWLRVGQVARIAMAGADADEVPRDIEGQTYAYHTGVLISRNEQVFTISDTPDPAIALITGVKIGSSGLALRADADVLDPVVSLADLLTINVYSVATRIVIFYTISGTDEELPASTPAESDVFRVPFNKTATLRAEGRDDLDNAVVLQDTVWTGDGDEKYSLAQTDPPDVNKRILTPILIGSSPLVLSGDGDPGAWTSIVFLFPTVSIAAPFATHLVESYALETPP